MEKSKDLIYKVRRNLWDRGYSVRDVSEFGLGFDLLVEGKFRVRVYGGREKLPPEAGCALASVHMGAGAFKGQVVIRYITPELNTIKPVEVFGLPLSKSKVEGYETKKVEGKKRKGN